MNDNPEVGGPEKGTPEKVGQTGRSRAVWFAVALAGLAAGTVLYRYQAGSGNSAPHQASPYAVALAGLAKGEVAAFALRDTPAPLPEITFKDAAGKDHTLAEWRGKLVLLNLWATWCVPCRHEMPALDALKASTAGGDFDVLALSTDRGGMDKPQKFWTDTGIKSLALYQDTGGAQHGLGVVGLPTTVLIGRDGSEIGRLVGPAEWASPEAQALIAAARKVN